MSRGAIDIKVLQTLIPERKPHFFRSTGACPPLVFDPTEKRRLERSAGACPPRSPRRNEKRPQPGGHGRLLSRSMHGEGQALALQRNGDGFLLPNDHLPRCFKITRGQRIEIHAASNRLTRCIPAIPIRCAVFV